jgi:hypothetical protein
MRVIKMRKEWLHLNGTDCYQEHLWRDKIRRRVGNALRGRNPEKNVGCSQAEFKAYLTKLFKRGMTWKNYPKIWHIDHDAPLDLFDPRYPEHVARVSHYWNLKPMFAPDNLKKANKWAGTLPLFKIS